jgi:hypothetical protein
MRTLSRAEICRILNVGSFAERLLKGGPDCFTSLLCAAVALAIWRIANVVRIKCDGL